MSSRRQTLLARVNWYLQSSLKHITELITGNTSFYWGGRYRHVSLYLINQDNADLLLNNFHALLTWFRLCCCNNGYAIWNDVLFNKMCFTFKCNFPKSPEWTQYVVTSVMSLAVMCPIMSSPQTQQLVRPTANAKQRLRFGIEQNWKHSFTIPA